VRWLAKLFYYGHSDASGGHTGHRGGHSAEVGNSRTLESQKDLIFCFVGFIFKTNKNIFALLKIGGWCAFLRALGQKPSVRGGRMITMGFYPNPEWGGIEDYR
jgi:hypothetical protein